MISKARYAAAMILAVLPAPVAAGEIATCPDGDMGCLMDRSTQVDPSLDTAYNAEAASEKARYADDPKMLKMVLASLEQSQAAFRDYRKFECTSEAYMAFGGSMERQLNIECRIRLTNQRIRELDGLKEGLRTWNGLR